MFGDKTHKKIVKKISKELNMDERVISQLASDPFIFTSNIIRDPLDERPIRLRYLGILAIRKGREKHRFTNFYKYRHNKQFWDTLLLIEMARLFDIDGHKVVPNPDIIAIPFLKVIWDRDKTKEKLKALKEYAYIALMCDYYSPYRDIAENEKSSLIIEDLFGSESNWEPDKKILEAIEKYKKLQETRHLRMLRSLEHIEDQITAYNYSVDLLAKDDLGRPLYNMTDVVRNSEKVGNIIKSLALVEKQVEREMSEQTTRGQEEIGYFEDPDNVE